MPDPATIRPAQLADADALGRLHMPVWRATYRDIAPQALIDKLEDRQ
ncbi:hypothetical protein VK792_05375 [Mesobacterium sp. TK19101]|uniref:GNAT family N-acetyltransferase n=1 Tax=Mesobacterium hydrothermale TaxID=3111907 RepID=A0ABU6HE24_9RHOB|nr:hypothetical protein [Mesobacterium sp. TK19101]MEC3860707.1 hypothetical protein [Mesobacterium sp. TK19101]